MKMKRIGRKWAAAAMALAAGVMTAGAVEPVLDNLPGAPAQSRSYWEAVRAEAAAKKAAAADKAAVETAQSGGDFFTGKPFDADLGGYVFKYRTYDPHLGRWTTPDPSGFPDGANAFGYVADPMRALDPSGLQAYWIGKEDHYSPNEVQETLDPATFSWTVTHNGEVAMRGPATNNFRGMYDHAGSAGFVTWRGVQLGTDTFGQSFTLSLAERYAKDDGSFSWRLNGWTVTAGFLENAGASAADLERVNNRINPLGAQTSLDSLRGLSTLLYDYLLGAGAGVQGDLYYE